MGASLLSHRHRTVWLKFLREISGDSRVSLSIDSGDPSQRGPGIAYRLFPHAGRANQPILEYGADAVGPFQQLRHSGAPALAGRPVRCDIFRRDPTHARDRDSAGAGGHAPFCRLAGPSRCVSDDRRRNSDRATMRLGVGPSCRIGAIRRQADRSGDDRRSNFGSVLDSAGRSVDSRAPRVDHQPHRRTSIRVGVEYRPFAAPDITQTSCVVAQSLSIPRLAGLERFMVEIRRARFRAMGLITILNRCHRFRGLSTSNLS